MKCVNKLKSPPPPPPPRKMTHDTYIKFESNSSVKIENSHFIVLHAYVS